MDFDDTTLDDDEELHLTGKGIDRKIRVELSTNQWRRETDTVIEAYINEVSKYRVEVKALTSQIKEMARAIAQVVSDLKTLRHKDI